MKEYEVVYIDTGGNKKTFEIMANNTRHAIDSTLELRTDCRRVIRCAIKPMFEDNESTSN